MKNRLIFPYKESPWKYFRLICVICLSNARNVTHINGRGSFGRFMDLTVASSWRYKCFSGPLSSAEVPMLASLSWNMGKGKPLKEYRGKRLFCAKTPNMLRGRQSGSRVKSSFWPFGGRISGYQGNLKEFFYL